MFSSKIQGYLKDKIWKRWKMFHATDFQSLMYPCFTYCRILGMFPYKFNSTTFEASKLYYFVSSIVICICCIYNGIFIHELIIKMNSSTVRNLEAVCFYMISCFIMIITHVMSSSQMYLLQTILNVSLKLPPKSYLMLSRSIHVKDILGTIFLIVQISVTFPKIDFFDNFNSLIMIFTTYCMLVLFHMNMLYLNCIYVLNACLKNINDKLVHNFVVKDTQLCIPTLIEYRQRNQFLLIELKILKKWHLMVSNTVQMLNVIFSPQIVATIIIVFSSITFELYFYAVRWQDGICIIFDKHLFDIFIMTITYYVILITLLVWSCETGKNQAQKIRTSIHDLHNNTSNEEIKDELQLFSLQMLHCENSFSVKGLTVDATLLAVMVGSITTYMLILIQFLMTSHSCDEKSIISRR